MRIIVLSEYSSISLSTIRSHLEPHERSSFFIRPELVSSGFIRIDKRTDSEGGLEDCIFSVGKIGLLPLCDKVALWIEPRVPVNNLDYLVKRFGGIVPDGFSRIRGYAASRNHSDEMFRMIGTAFIDEVKTIRAMGLMRSYAEAKNPNGRTSGRIDFANTMRRYHSRGIKYAAISFSFNKTPQNNANVGIQFALQYLVATLPKNDKLRNEAWKELDYFSKATGIRNISSKPSYSIAKSEIPSSRAAYLPALALAESIVSGVDVDIESNAGSIASINLLVDMSDMFERYIRSIISEAELAATFEVLDGNRLKPSIPLFEDKFLDLPSQVKNRTNRATKAGGNNEVKPDILVRKGGGDRLVVDVKYKPISGNYSAKRTDIEQVITYSERLGLRFAVTIHPCMSNQPSGLYYSGTIGDIDLFCYLFDLASEDIANEESSLIDAIETLSMNQ